MAQKKVSIDVGVQTSGSAELKQLASDLDRTREQIERPFDAGEQDRFFQQMEAGFKEVAVSAERSAENMRRAMDSAFSTLGMKSTGQHKAEIKKLTTAYKALAQSGKASAGDLERAQEQLRQRVKALGAEFRKAGTTASTSLKKVKEESYALEKGLIAAGAAAAGWAMFRGASTSVNTFAGMDDMLRAAAAAMGATGEQFEQLTALAEEMGRTTRYKSSEAAEGLLMLGRAGMTAEQSMKALPGVLQLAAAGALDLGTASDIATNVLSGYGMQVDELGRVNDVLVKTFTSTNSTLQDLGQAFSYAGGVASSFGADFEETAAAIGLMHNVGVKANRAGTALATSITRLIDPPKEAADVLEKLGKRLGKTTLEVVDSEGKFVGFTRILEQFEKAGADGTDIMRVFGDEAGRSMVAMSKQGSAALRDLWDKIEAGGGVAKKTADEMEAGLGGSLRRLWSATEGLANTLGKDLAPVVSGLASIFSTLANVLSAIPQPIRWVLEGAVAAGAAFLAWKVIMAGLAITSIPRLVAALGTMGAGAAQVTAVSAAFSGVAPAAGAALTSVTALETGAVGLSGAMGAVSLATMGWIVAIGALGVAAWKLVDTVRTIQAEEAALKEETDRVSTSTRYLDERLEAYNQRLGTSFQSWRDLKQAVEDGVLVFDESTRTFELAAGAGKQWSNAAQGGAQDAAILAEVAKRCGLSVQEVTDTLAALERQGGPAWRENLSDAEQFQAALDSIAGTHPTVDVNVDDSAPRAALANLQQDTYSTHYIREQVIPANSEGGLIRRYATGGLATGWRALSGKLPGFGGGDRVRALLEAGEYVSDKSTVRFWGAGFFRRLKSLARSGVTERVSGTLQGGIPRFAEGGMVQAVAAATAPGPASTHVFRFQAGQTEFPVTVQGADSRDMMHGLLDELVKQRLVRRG